MKPNACGRKMIEIDFSRCEILDQKKDHLNDKGKAATSALESIPRII